MFSKGTKIQKFHITCCRAASICTCTSLKLIATATGCWFFSPNRQSSTKYSGNRWGFVSLALLLETSCSRCRLEVDSLLRDLERTSKFVSRNLAPLGICRTPASACAFYGSSTAGSKSLCTVMRMSRTHTTTHRVGVAWPRPWYSNAGPLSLGAGQKMD